MEEKKEIKVSLGTVICIVIIVILLCALAFVYYLGFVKEDNKEIAKPQDNEIVFQEEKTNTVIQENVEIVEENKEDYEIITKELEGIDVLFVTDAIENSNNTYTLKGVIYTQYTISYKELSEILEKGSMTIESEEYTIKKNDNEGGYDLLKKDDEYVRYKLKEINYNEYYLESQAQIMNNWKLTDEYKEITVSNDTKCDMAFDYEEKYNTVEDVFNNFERTKPLETKNPDSEKTFIFKFENNKCVEIINVLTSI